jgi:hypothetical protein
MNIQLVPLSMVHQLWSLVEGFLTDGLKHADDDYTIDQIKSEVSKGSWMLLVAVDETDMIQGAMTVHIYNAPNHRIAFVTSTGGRFIINKDTFKQFCNLVKSFGATKVRGVGRDSVVRLLSSVGMKKRYTTFEADL